MVLAAATSEELDMLCISFAFLLDCQSLNLYSAAQ